jgi:hypothetical protein
MTLLQSLGMIERGGRDTGVRRYGHRKRPVRQIEVAMPGSAFSQTARLHNGCRYPPN